VTKSAGHGDFHSIVLAPTTIQEAINLTGLAFDLAEKYRTIVFVVADGAIGQMMEPAELPPMRSWPDERPSWALTGANGREKNIITSLYLGAENLEHLNQKLQNKLVSIQASEVRYEAQYLEDADVVLVAFGTAARVAQTVLQNLRREGLRVGLFRPITLWPFPVKQLAQLSRNAKGFFVIEMNAGQMLHDVRNAVASAVGSQTPVGFYGRMGGVIPMPNEVAGELSSWLLHNKIAKPEGHHGHTDS
jgi:2-oxoglutarate ferredoxin oxidoreductase subunit alpha